MGGIVCTPGVCGGRARIDGTRIDVRLIVALWERGLNDEQILELYPFLTVAQLDDVRKYLKET